VVNVRNDAEVANVCSIFTHIFLTFRLL
jgi:hypothetical protein